MSAIRGLQKECWVKRAYSTCLADNSLSLHDLFLLAVLAYPRFLFAALRAISSMRKRPQDQGSLSSKRSTPTCLATEQTPEEHMTINSLDDVVSKLAFECDESAAVLRNAVQTLQGGVQAEVRNLCSRWNVQLTSKNDNGKYRKRADHILKSELENTFIAKAKEHFRAKATENQPIQLKKETDAPTSSSATERAGSGATEHAKVEFSIEDAIAETLHRIKSIDAHIEILVRIVDHACHSQQCVSHRVATMCREAKFKISTDLFDDQPLDACGINPSLGISGDACISSRIFHPTPST